MKRPRFAMYVIGNPVALLLAIALLLFGIYRWTQDSASWPLTAIALACVSLSSNASTRIDAYRDWKREWDGMASSQVRHKASPLLGMLLVIGLGLFLIAHAREPIYAMALAGLMLSIIMAGLAWLAVRVKSARQRAAARTPKAQPNVMVCVRGPLLPVPELRDAYRALPPHCHALFSTSNNLHVR